MNHAIQRAVATSNFKRGQVPKPRGVAYGPVVCLAAWLCVGQPAHGQTPLPDDFNPGANGGVNSLAVQADGKILVGGNFTTLGGQTRNYIGRLNADGSLDGSFNPGVGASLSYGESPWVNSLAVQADGKILVGGGFTTLGGQTRNCLGRLNADGSLDSGFNPGVGGSLPYGQSPWVYPLAVQADGKILVGGGFTTLAGQTRNYIGRLNPDGSLDSSFNPGADGLVQSLAVQADGKILVGGSFTTLGGQTRNCVGRLNADGSLDSSFNPGAGGQVATYVDSLAVQADGKIVVGGNLTTLGGQTRPGIGRVNADGSLDSSFSPGLRPFGSGDFVSCLAVQADGKILVGGYFTTLGGQTPPGIGRLNADGSLDSSFNPGAPWSVSGLAVQADGKILVGGSFTTLGGRMRNNIGRLNSTGPATQSLSYDGSTTTWLRGGTSPEVWRTTFDFSANAVDWVSFGAGTRIAGGWQLTNTLLPPSTGTIRARGFVAGGGRNCWFVEGYWGNLVVVGQPSSRTNDAGTTASFAVVANGAEPLGYQWLKNGLPLADGANVSGALTPTLTLSSVLWADAGQFAVVVTNASGSVTSMVAALTVNDPVITAQPASQIGLLRQNATLVFVQKLIPICSRKDGVVPQGQDRVFENVHLGHLAIGDFNFGEVVPRVQGALDP